MFSVIDFHTATVTNRHHIQSLVSYQFHKWESERNTLGASCIMEYKVLHKTTGAHLSHPRSSGLSETPHVR